MVGESVEKSQDPIHLQLAFELDTRSEPRGVSRDADAVTIPLAPGREPMVVLDRKLKAGGVPGASPNELAGALGRFLDAKLTLHVHDNRSTMVSFQRKPGHVDLRVHHMFLRADENTVRALAEYARSGSKQAGDVLDEFVERHQSAIRAQDPSTTRVLEAKGKTHDLRCLFDELNRGYFNGAVDAKIGWSRKTTSASRRSVRLGAYFEKNRTILIHPSLDAPHVPRVFVAFVVYHEMLHQAVPAERSARGRRNVHPPEFRRRERLFLQYAEARRLERRHLAMLLSASARAADETAGDGY